LIVYDFQPNLVAGQFPLITISSQPRRGTGDLFKPDAECNRLADYLPALDAASPQALLKGLGAVRVNERLIASERIGYRSFRLWGRLLMSLGEPRSLLRRIVLCFYIVFLATMILTVAPVSAVIKRFVAPWMRERIARQRAYFAAPSGEADDARGCPAHG